MICYEYSGRYMQFTTNMMITSTFFFHLYCCHCTTSAILYISTHRTYISTYCCIVVSAICADFFFCLSHLCGCHVSVPVHH